MSDTKLKREDEIEKRSDDLFNHPDLADLERRANRVEQDSANDGVSSAEKALRQESESGFANNVTGKSQKNRFKDFTGNLSLKKKGPLAAIILLLVVGVGGPLALLPLGPIMFVENITRDLNDRVAAMDGRFLHMARNKIPKGDRAKALKGCGTIVTVRCKFATVGKKQLAKLKYAGITVEGDKAFAIRDRTVPKTYEFRGEKFTPSQWGNLLDAREAISQKGIKFSRGSPMHTAAINAQRTANNARYSSVSDESFLSRVMKRFGVSKRAPELKGKTHAERVNALLNKAGTGNVGDLSFTKVLDANGEETGKFTLDGDANVTSTEYTQKEVDKMQKSINNIKTAKVPSKLKTTALGVLSVTGYADIACTVNNTLRAATVAAKIANLRQSIQFAAPVLASVQKIKAGDATAEDSETIGRFFNDTDAREKISDLANATSDSPDDVSTVTNIPTKPNPNYGKSALDSDLYKMSSNGGVAPSTETRNQFSLGFGQNALLGFMQGSTAAFNKIVNLDVGACKTVQSWWVRGAGLITGVALIATGGGAIAQGAKAVGIATLFAGALFGLDKVINNALSNNLVEDSDLKNDKVAAGELAWTGEAGMMQVNAQASGMMPGSAEQIVQYQDQSKNTQLAYDDIERSGVTNQFDINNEFSFVGSLARKVSSITPKSISASSSLLSSLSIVKNAASTLTTDSYAAGTDIQRFKQCDDETYTDLGIDADVQCNIRYVMPADELSMDTDAVAKYMEEKYVDPVTGLPEGYYPPDPASAESSLKDKIAGVGEGIVDSVTPDKYTNDYARFLEYCVYRTMPYGETGKDGGEDAWSTGKNCLKTGVPYNYFRVYTMDKTVNEAEDHVDNTSGNGLSVMTHNILGESQGKKNGNDGGLSMATRANAAISIIKDKQPAIIGLQEVNDSQFNYIVPKLDGYDSWPKTSKGPDQPETILWDTSKLEKVEGGTYKYPKNQSTSTSPWVKLKSLSGSGFVYVFNTHPTAQKASYGPGERKRATEVVLKEIKKVNTDNSPVIITGDFNSTSYKRDGNDNSVSTSDLPPSLYKAAGYTDTHDLAGIKTNDDYKSSHGDAGVARKKDNRSDKQNKIDHIFVSSQITASTWENVIDDSSRTASDHTPLIASLAIPGFPTTNDNSSVSAPVNINGYVFPVALSGLSSGITVNQTKTKHWGNYNGFDLMSKGGTPVYAIHDGSIVKVNRSYTFGSGKGKPCESITYASTDGYFYWYGHVINTTRKTGSIKAGEKIAEVADNSYGSLCNGGGSHLHIDRNKDRTLAGRKGDPSFIPQLSKIYESAGGK